MLRKVIISGGGTGGHIFPAIAIANEIRKRYPACDILFVGANDRMEMDKVPQAGYKIVGLPISGIQRKLTLKNALVPFRLLKSILMARRIIIDFGPQVVIGVGGYASGAVLYVAAGRKIPTLVQEQNSYAGLTNKWLGKKVRKICVAYDNMQRFFPADKIVVTGNPVREELYAAHHMDRQLAKTRLGFDTNKPLVLVIGGSLGARTINLSMQNGVKAIHEAGAQVLWQTGKGFRAKTYYLEGIKSSEFIIDMATAYAAADIVVSRAGAIAVSEICLLGKPCILVPLPHATEDHQTRNAMALVEKHAAVLVKDSEADRQLVKEITKLVFDKDEQARMAGNIAQFARPDALQEIVNQVESIVP